MQHMAMYQGGGFDSKANDNRTGTSIFVGGLGYQTQSDVLKHYFQQFGRIQEAVVVMDKQTGQSKGYGYVTFTDAMAAQRACSDPSPNIDGRRGNYTFSSAQAVHGLIVPNKQPTSRRLLYRPPANNISPTHLLPSTGRPPYNPPYLPANNISRAYLPPPTGFPPYNNHSRNQKTYPGGAN